MYLALYRKWRPKTFDDVVGQPHISPTLKNEVKNNRIAHAYLFTGPRGTGKTTCSKTLAMAVNCLNSIDGDPCMECANCVGIEQGTTLDVVEIDAASNNGVDNIRQLRDEASYTPVQCKYRVYIIDETHMLSTGAFNALLKIMEEPPSHVLFILATTEAHKVPATILSRCQRFDFRRIKADDIRERLLYIASQEDGFTLTTDAADLIARLADGGMRDAISLLDQCTAYDTTVTVEVVTEAAGVVDKDYLYKITDAIINQDAEAAITLVDTLYSMSKDLVALLDELIYHFRSLMLTKAMRKPEVVIPLLPEQQGKLAEYAGKLSLNFILNALTHLQECMDEISKSVDKRLRFELCLIRLCTPSGVADSDVSKLSARVEKLENIIKSGGFLPSSTPVNGVVASQPTASFTPPPPPTPINETASVGESEPMEQWSEILTDFEESDKPLWAALRGSTAYVHGGFLVIETPLDFAAELMKQEGNAARLKRAVAARTGVSYKIGLKSSTKQPVQTENNPMDEMLEKAKNLGVTINETGNVPEN